jgi:sarcosine oxidase delta subunit
VEELGKFTLYIWAEQNHFNIPVEGWQHQDSCYFFFESLKRVSETEFCLKALLIVLG